MDYEKAYKITRVLLSDILIKYEGVRYDYPHDQIPTISKPINKVGPVIYELRKLLEDEDSYEDLKLEVGPIIAVMEKGGAS